MNNINKNDIPEKVKFSFWKEFLCSYLVAFGLFNIIGFNHISVCVFIGYFSAICFFSFSNYKKIKKLNFSIDCLQRMERIISTPRYEKLENSIILKEINVNKELLDNLKKIAEIKK